MNSLLPLFTDQLGCPFTVRRLLLEADLEKVLSILDGLHGNSDNKEGYRKVYRTLLAKPPTPPGYPIVFEKGFFSESSEDGPYVDIHFWNPHYEAPPKDLEPHYGGGPLPAGHYDAEQDKYQQTFSMSFCSWSQIIDASLWAKDESVFQIVPFLEEAAAQILWEITFYSFSEEKGQQFFEKLREEILEYRKEKNVDKTEGKE